MDLQEYIKKVYTIAFRLTGDETAAEGVASLAINRNANSIKDIIDTNILYKTARDVFSIFLTEPDKYTSLSANDCSPVQRQFTHDSTFFPLTTQSKIFNNAVHHH
jgi:hypothetical protein